MAVCVFSHFLQHADEDDEYQQAVKNKNLQYKTNRMLDKLGVDAEEADLAAAKIQAQYRKVQVS